MGVVGQSGAPMAASELSNTLTHVWDNWAVKSRLTWQKVFSPGARQAVTQQAPELKTPKTLKAASKFEEPSQFKPIPGTRSKRNSRHSMGPFHMGVRCVSLSRIAVGNFMSGLSTKAVQPAGCWV